MKVKKPSYDQLVQKNIELENKLYFPMTLLNNTYDWEIFRDDVGKITYCSPGIESVIGYKKEPFISGEILFDNLIHPADLEFANNEYKKVQNRKIVQSCQFRMIRKDTSIAYVDVSSQPVYNADNEYLGFRTSIKDITQKKINELKLLESESLLNTTQKLAKMGGWVYNIQSQEGIITDNIKDIYGKELDKIEDGLDSYHPEDQALVWNAFSEAIEKKKPFDLKVRLINENGTLIHVRTIGQPIVENGKVVKIFGNLMDITQQVKAEQALKKNQEKLQTILKTIPDIIFHLNREGKFIGFYQENSTNKLFINPALFLDKPLSEIFEKELADRMLEKIHIALEKGTSELEYQLPMGKIKYFESKFSRLNQDEVIASVRDITERKKTEQTLIENDLQLREHNATKDKIFSVIAHDLRGPFTNILGLSELLIENGKNLSSGESEEYLELINSTAKHTLSLLDNLLNWATAKSDRQSNYPEKLNLSSIIRNIAQKLKSPAKNKNIKLIQNQVKNIIVFADENMLKVILRNLIYNAIKFTKPGGSINIYTYSKPNQAEISIIDTGIGIKEESKEKLFSLDTNKTTLGTSEEKGSGLGLILCKEFVEKLGGEIWVESIVGKGSNFTFTIPLYED